MIRLGQSDDGRLILGSNESFPADIRHVEYDRALRLFNLVFDTEDDQSALMPCGICCRTAALVEKSPSLIIIAMAEKGASPYGYIVPLVQIGV